jgi:hypothetical protein
MSWRSGLFEIQFLLAVVGYAPCGANPPYDLKHLMLENRNDHEQEARAHPASPISPWP